MMELGVVTAKKARPNFFVIHIHTFLTLGILSKLNIFIYLDILGNWKSELGTRKVFSLFFRQPI